MEVVRPRFEPDPGLTREEMEALQHELAAVASFRDDLPFDPATLSIDDPIDASDAIDPSDPFGPSDATGPSTSIDPGDPDPDATAADGAAASGSGAVSAGPVVAGVDQAFLDDRAVSAVVAIRGGSVVERVHAVTALEIPYIPGLLAFREGRPILAALAELSVEPDLLVLDGSGRIHYRQAGIATHVGVMVDVPAVGVAKRLLCGEPERTWEAGLPEGDRVRILADDEVDAPDGTVLGHAYQSRQYDAADRHVNPLYVSPGHRVGATTATDLVAACCAGYKLPEPTRLADRAADELKAAVAE